MTDQIVEVNPYDEETAQTEDHVEVYTYPRPTDPAVTLAMVTANRVTGPNKVTWFTIVDKEPMSAEEALERGKAWAIENGVPLVLVHEGGTGYLDYKGYRIRPAPFPLQGGCYSLQVYIIRDTGDNITERPFSAEGRFDHRTEANAAAVEFGKRIIDGEVEGLTVEGL